MTANDARSAVCEECFVQFTRFTLAANFSLNCECIIQFGDTKNFVHYIFNTFCLRVLYSLSLLKIVFIGG